MSSKVQKRAASESLLFLSLVGGILVLLNVLIAYFPSPRVDLTQNGLFSLAEGSERLAASLDDRLAVTAYFTENLPPPFNATERHVRDLLSEYSAASNGQIIVKSIPTTRRSSRRRAPMACNRSRIRRSRKTRSRSSKATVAWSCTT
ncbi:MAG: Gldg family protein [Deltaproteobacteria bacterium]|nr:Gldg family protein [Deltaproteobacteria bacterium]